MEHFKNKDDFFMNMAIKLAKKGTGLTSPNPLVGCVIVKKIDNTYVILGQGYHEKFGKLHAERNAIKNAKENITKFFNFKFEKNQNSIKKEIFNLNNPLDFPYLHKRKILKNNISLENSILYVNLEPCCHYGKTPPCTKAIIENKIGQVIVGSLDPNKKVRGKGIEILKKQNIKVKTGILESECKKLNEIFFHYITKKTPFVILKSASTLDGKISTCTGDSKWITNEKSRKLTHVLRQNLKAIMVGINTILKDNPTLNTRISKKDYEKITGISIKNYSEKNPIRIIADTNLITPLNSNIILTGKEIKTIIATCEKNKIKHEKYIKQNIEILIVNKKNNHLDLQDLMYKLGEKQIDSILLEGGGTLNFSMLEENLVNKIYSFISPKIFGGKEAKTWVEGNGVNKIENSFNLNINSIKKIDTDILIESEVLCSQV